MLCSLCPVVASLRFSGKDVMLNLTLNLVWAYSCGFTFVTTLNVCILSLNQCNFAILVSLASFWSIFFCRVEAKSLGTDSTSFLCSAVSFSSCDIGLVFRMCSHSIHSTFFEHTSQTFLPKKFFMVYIVWSFFNFIAISWHIVPFPLGTSSVKKSFFEMQMRKIPTYRYNLGSIPFWLHFTVSSPQVFQIRFQNTLLTGISLLLDSLLHISACITMVWHGGSTSLLMVGYIAKMWCLKFAADIALCSLLSTLAHLLLSRKWDGSSKPFLPTILVLFKIDQKFLGRSFFHIFILLPQSWSSLKRLLLSRMNRIVYSQLQHSPLRPGRNNNNVFGHAL